MAEITLRVCPGCGKSEGLVDSKGRSRKFCSRECQHDLTLRNRQYDPLRKNLEGCLMPKVVSVETMHLEDEVDVFDVEVETDASFIVGNSVLHNSGICRARAGKLWTLEGAPIGHTLPFFLCPLHWNCRSHVIAVMHAHGSMPSRIQRRIRKEDFDGRSSPEPDLEMWLEIRGEERDPGPLDYQTARKLLGL